MTFFGPETPRPFSVISEHYFQDILDQFDTDLVESSQSDLLNDYDINLCDLIKSYLDIDCNHDVLFVKCINNDYIGGFTELTRNEKTIKNWPKIFEKKFCLVKPIHMCQISQSDDLQNLEYTYYKLITKYENSVQSGVSKFKIEVEIIKTSKYDKII